MSENVPERGGRGGIFDRSFVRRHSLTQIKEELRSKNRMKSPVSYTFAKPNFNFLSNKRDAGKSRRSPVQLEFYAWNQLGKQS